MKPVAEVPPCPISPLKTKSKGSLIKMLNSRTSVAQSVIDDSGIFRRCLEKDLHGQMEVPGLISKLLLAFCISLGSNTENPGSKQYSCFHIFICTFFSELKNVDGKSYTKLAGCNRVPLHQCFVCASARVHAFVWRFSETTTVQLQTHC